MMRMRTMMVRNLTRVVEIKMEAAVDDQQPEAATTTITTTTTTRAATITKTT